MQRRENCDALQLRKREAEIFISAALQQSHDSQSYEKSEADSEQEEPQQLPKAGAARGLPNGQLNGRPSRMRMDTRDEPNSEEPLQRPYPGKARDLQSGRQPSRMRMDTGEEPDSEEPLQRPIPGKARDLQNRQQPSRVRMDFGEEPDSDAQQEGSQAPARKRLRSSVLQSVSARATSQTGVAQRLGRGLRSTPDGEDAEESDAVDAHVGARRQQSKEPRSNGQAADLRSRLSNGARGEAPAGEGAAGAGLGVQQVSAKSGAKRGRGLFGAALTGLQR